MRRLLLLVITALVASTATRPSAQQGTAPNLNDLNAARPIEAGDSVFIDELTWMEVRDAISGGKKTAIVATGGVEQNGPYLTTGKHNFVLRATTEAIARKLGDALVAPIIAFVPEGRIDPPSGAMRYPGTISLQETTFRALLTDIASSLKQHGFENIVLIGDSGGNQAGMKQVAAELGAQWGGKPGIYFIPEFYDYASAKKFAEAELGIKEVPEGIHDDYIITSIIMTVDPTQVRLKQREAKNKATINGVSITPSAKAIEHGKKIVDFRATQTVAAIREALASGTQAAK
jgi:creatinine amidohydrolase/Fe(II)-dependent formamide hydrolase-like protein